MPTIQTNNISNELLTTMNGAKAGSRGVAAEAQDRFMTLLVTQMRNQDPLNPLDNAQVTSQLAQLSTVTGIDKLNSTLEALKGSYQTSQTLQAAGMIGRGVLVSGSDTSLSEGRAHFGAELDAPVDQLEVRMLNASGSLVYSANLGPQESGIQAFEWDGKTDRGTAAPDGAYKFELVATRGGQKANVASLAFGTVGSVSTGTDGVKINVPGMRSLTLNDIRQIL